MRRKLAVVRAKISWRGVRDFLFVGDKARAGVAAIEFAAVVPFLVLGFIMAMDLGLGIRRGLQLQNAAQAGAAYAGLHPDQASLHSCQQSSYYYTNIANAVTSATSLSNISFTYGPRTVCGCATSTGLVSADYGDTCSNGATAGIYVEFGISSPYQTIIPYPWLQDTYNLNAKVEVRVQ
jgi:Flp pilus assembly protein TadG